MSRFVGEETLEKNADLKRMHELLVRTVHLHTMTEHKSVQTMLWRLVSGIYKYM